MSNLLAQLMALDDNPRNKSRKEAVRSPYGYVGSKERSLDHLLPLLPYRDTYVEHCGGSGAVLLARNQCKLEVFNDRHSGITAFYMCIADRAKCKLLADRIQLTIHSREYFEWCKETWEQMHDDVERAARWYVSLHLSFNQKGWQFGRSVKPPGFIGAKLRDSIEHFDPLHHRLKRVQIENLDWRQCVSDYDSLDTVHYFDPPYWKIANCYDHSWSDTDHIELCERIFNQIKGFVALSGYDSEDHPYNNYKWDDKYSWEVAVTATGLDFQESSNKAHKKGEIKRGTATETVWIRR